jgi:hypothetical protein
MAAMTRPQQHKDFLLTDDETNSTTDEEINSLFDESDDSINDTSDTEILSNKSDSDTDAKA